MRIKYVADSILVGGGDGSIITLVVFWLLT
jgi:hypothetical protein